MRVAITAEQFWHVVPGGIATSTLELLRGLAARGDVDVVGVAARHRRPPADAFASPVPIRQLPLPRRVLYETWQRLRRPLVERATGAVDVVHDVGNIVPPSRAPLVATVHDLWFLAHPDDYTPHSAAVLVRGFELARRHARLIVCPSQASIDACVEAGIELERLRLVPWGVTPRRLSEDDVAAVIRRMGLTRRYVLFSGTIQRRKNVLGLLRAFERLDRADVDIVLAGPIGWNDPAWSAALDAAVARLGSRCRLLGDVPVDDLDALCAAASVIVYPSFGEGFGFPVLFGMAQGTPVVTSAGTATAEVAGDAAILIDPLDEDGIAGAIQRVLGDPELAAALGARGRRRVAAFPWRRSADLAVEVYREAIELSR